ncbi:MAG: maleylpyruvate isomerase family mycothiol-dependent enzyme [Actinobacteria bacterium]|nr:maleylpyruvate isomerase family mycothiol-dependent enzyme [Actinomycetota bacterium]MCA1721148.1 maleylpyruvate isomerase family mycothiol-dependent enzyme [Actinomycetota bacterium]
MTPSEHYRSQRERVTALVQDLDEEQLATRVPGCPEWTVRELLSHLTGLARDVAEERMDDAGQPHWTARQVADRQDRSVEELLAEWSDYGPQVEAMLDGMGFAGYRTFYDATMHEDDLREALGLPLAEGPTQTEVLGGLVMLAGGRLTGLPPLEVRAGEQSWTFCDSPSVAVLTAPDAGELGRVLGGRRSAEQLRALDWAGDPEPYLDALTQFRPGV